MNTNSCCKKCGGTDRKGFDKICASATCPCHSKPPHDPQKLTSEQINLANQSDASQPPHEPQEGWEREFVNKFQSGGYVDTLAFEIKDFIKQLLVADRAQERKRIEEGLERLRDVYDDDVDSRNDKYRIEGRNKALRDVQEIIYPKPNDKV